MLEEAASDTATLEDIEKTYIEKVLARTDGNQSEAAEILGISRRTLYRKMQTYGIEGIEE